jgi:ribosomal-protein-alanine N-acetyltransferase
MKLAVPEYMETERVSLSRLKHEDAEEIFYSYASKPQATKFMSWPTHQSIDDTREFLSRTVYGWNAGIDYSFGIRLREGNRLIGSCGLLNEEGSIQFGYILSPVHWGHGYATEVCRKLMETVRNLPEVYRVSTFVDAENVASAKVLFKSGLVRVAKMEKWARFVNQHGGLKDCLLFRLPLDVN